MKTIEELESGCEGTLWGIQPLPQGMYSGFVKLPDCGTCTVVFGYNEDGFEHVSVAPRKKFRIPSWDDMAKLKDIFFKDEEEAYQIMPKRSEYVNLKTNCLHLWRPTNGKELNELTEEEAQDGIHSN